MGVLFALALWGLAVTPMSPAVLNVVAAILTAIGIVLLALADAAVIRSVRISASEPEPKEPPSSRLNSPGTVLRFYGHALLIAGVIYLVFATVRAL